MPARQSSTLSARHRRLAPGWISLWLVFALLAGPWLQTIASSLPLSSDIPAMAICSTSGMQTAPGAPLAHAANHCQLCCGNHAPPLPVTGQLAAGFSAANYAMAARLPISPSFRPVAMPALARAPPIA